MTTQTHQQPVHAGSIVLASFWPKDTQHTGIVCRLITHNDRPCGEVIMNTGIIIVMSISDLVRVDQVQAPRGGFRELDAREQLATWREAHQ